MSLLSCLKNILSFRFPGFPGRKRKGSKRTNVLREGKEEGSDVDHLTSKGREEVEALREAREATTAVFRVRNDGVSWRYEDLIVCHVGSSAYIVYIQGKEGREEDTIECKVPHIWAMLDLVSRLTQGKHPLFTSFAEHKPTGTI